MQAALKESTESGARDNTLIVYRQNRFCPFTSHLPEHYRSQIREIPGVEDVTSIKVLVSNCGTSLDVITFRGIPEDGLPFFSPSFQYLDGSEANWKKRRDSAIIGNAVAQRRKLKVGDTFESAGVTAYVAAIIDSDDPQNRNTAYTHLDFLQQASKSGLGTVTQFNIKVDDPSKMDEVAKAVDQQFRSAQEPTHTRPEKAFFAKAARSIVSLISFTRWVGLAAVCAVLALVSNTIMMAVRGRIKENAVLQTVGYGAQQIIWLVVVEGTILGLLGGLISSAMVSGILYWGAFTLSSEGLCLVFSPDPVVMGTGMLISLLIGLLAGIFPAWQASRKNIVDSLRQPG